MLNYKEQKERRIKGSLLKSWYGDEMGVVEQAGCDTIYTMFELTQQFAAKRFGKNFAIRQKISQEWETIVGKQVAKLTTFAYMQEKVIYLNIRHSAFLQEELLSSADLVIKKINDYFKQEICTEIRFCNTKNKSV